MTMVLSQESIDSYIKVVEFMLNTFKQNKQSGIETSMTLKNGITLNIDEIIEMYEMLLEEALTFKPIYK